MGHEGTGERRVTDQRVPGVILHPLAEVGVGMFVPIVVGSRQLMVNLQRCGKRGHREQEARDEQRDNRSGFLMHGVTKHDHPDEQKHRA